MEGDKYQALASNSVSQERRKLELLVMEASFKMQAGTKFLWLHYFSFYQRPSIS